MQTIWHNHQHIRIWHLNHPTQPMKPPNLNLPNFIWPDLTDPKQHDTNTAPPHTTWHDVTRCDLTWPDPTWPDLAWPEVIGPDLTWLNQRKPGLTWTAKIWTDLTWSDQTWLDLIWPVLLCLELTWPFLIWYDMIRHDMTWCPTWPNTTKLSWLHILAEGWHTANSIHGSRERDSSIRVEQFF